MPLKQLQASQQQQLAKNAPQEKQQKETGKRKLDTKEEASPQKQSSKKLKVEESAQPKEAKEKQPKKNVQMAKVPTETENAILAEEARRRQERDKRSLFLKSEMLAKMTPNEVKALHPDVISVRPMHNVWIESFCTF